MRTLRNIKSWCLKRMFITVSFIIADTLKQGIPQYNMDEQTVVRPYYGIVFGTEKE